MGVNFFQVPGNFARQDLKSKTKSVSLMSDSEEGPIPESQYDNLMGNGVGEDFIEAGIIQSIELTNFMCHAYESCLWPC